MRASLLTEIATLKRELSKFIAVKTDRKQRKKNYVNFQRVGCVCVCVAHQNSSNLHAFFFFILNKILLDTANHLLAIYVSRYRATEELLSIMM